MGWGGVIFTCTQRQFVEVGNIEALCFVLLGGWEFMRESRRADIYIRVPGKKASRGVKRCA